MVYRFKKYKINTNPSDPFMSVVEFEGYFYFSLRDRLEPGEGVTGFNIGKTNCMGFAYVKDLEEVTDTKIIQALGF